jgi:hypothetical protein
LYLGRTFHVVFPLASPSVPAFPKVKFGRPAHDVVGTTDLEIVVVRVLSPLEKRYLQVM